MSIKDTRSSLFPTATVDPSGDQHRFKFSPATKQKVVCRNEVLYCITFYPNIYLTAGKHESNLTNFWKNIHTVTFMTTIALVESSRSHETFSVWIAQQYNIKPDWYL